MTLFQLILSTLFDGRLKENVKQSESLPDKETSITTGLTISVRTALKPHIGKMKKTAAQYQTDSTPAVAVGTCRVSKADADAHHIRTERRARPFATMAALNIFAQGTQLGGLPCYVSRRYLRLMIG